MRVVPYAVVFLVERGTAGTVLGDSKNPMDWRLQCSCRFEAITTT
jgi:hypothetical protein